MSRLNRLMLTAVAFGVAACGDDVTVTPPPPTPVTVVVTPDGATIDIGQTLQMNAAVSGGDGSAATIAWSSSNNATATVSNTGLVTGVADGSVGITATATVGTSSGAGSATVTVESGAPELPPTVSIANITNTICSAANQCSEVPVNLAAAAGQVNVALNLERNNNPVTKVALLLGDVEVASQEFTPSAPVGSGAAAVPEVIVLSVNTAEFDLETGAARFTNGATTLSAQVEVEGGEGPAAGNSRQLTLANQSGIVFLGITNENTNEPLGDITFPASALDPDGLAWTAGDHTLNLLGVSYVAGARIASASISLFGQTQNVTLAEGAVTSVVYAADDEIEDYQTADSEDGESPEVNSSVLSNGQPGPSIDLNSLSVPLPNVPALPVARVDNVDPDESPVFVSFPLWVNAAFDMQGAIDTEGEDDGVNDVQTLFFSGDLPSDACDVEGLEAVAAGEDLEESTEITAHDIRAITFDALGNRVCDDPGTVGADFTAPEVTDADGPSTGDTFTAAPVGSFAIAVTDNASGFTGTPLVVEMSRLNPDGTTDCLIGSASSCDDTDQARALTFDATDGLTDEGYYTTNILVSDEAGNTVQVEGLPATYLLDGTAPTFAAGGLQLESLYEGNSAATFTAPDASDNIDLGTLTGLITYPTATIQNPSSSLGSFGAPLEKGPADAVLTIPSFIRCLNAAGNFAAGATKPTTITLRVADQAGNSTDFAGAIPGGNVEDCGDVATPAQFDAGFSTDASETTVSRDDPEGNDDPTSTVLSAVADVQLDETPNPFVRVDFYWVDGGGNLRFIGSDATGQLAETQTDRTWTWTFTWNPEAPVPTGGPVTVVAIGVDAQGDAVMSATVAITVNP